MATLNQHEQTVTNQNNAGHDINVTQLMQYPTTDRENEENQTSSPAAPFVDDSNRTTPNTSRVFALGKEEDAVPQQPQVFQATQFCTVTAPAGLNLRAEPNTQSRIITGCPQGTILNFFEVKMGEFMNGNPRWGHGHPDSQSPMEEYYFWMGGTDRPQG